MAYRSNPLAGLLLVLGAGLCVGAMGWDGANDLIEWPVIVVTVAAALVIVLALAALLGGGLMMDAIALVVALLLAGYVANQVVLSVWLSRTFADGVVIAAAGSAVLIAAGASTLHTLVRVRTPRPRPVMPATIAAHPGAAVAAAGWYPDPAGGGGQRYWDGAAWGQAHP